ncbi:MAG: rod shape-determining protein MreD [Clostridia bacterium]|nr:rod shape-determining protein MreD [Clostridia bacterium]
MSKLRLILWVGIITVFETVLSRYISIGSIFPDILFTFVLCYALSESKPVSIMGTATVCGIIADCMSGRIFGNYLAVYIICAVGIFILRDFIYKESFLVALLLVFMATIFGKSIFYLINISILKQTGYIYSLIEIIVPEAVYNTVISALLFPFVKKSFVRKVGTFR